MIWIALFISTFISCLIYDILKPNFLIKKLSKSYKLQLKIMLDKKMEDGERQKKLLWCFRYQLKKVIQLIVTIILTLTPFTTLLLWHTFIQKISIDLLYSWESIVLSLFAIFLFVLLKNGYVKIFKNRKAFT